MKQFIEKESYKHLFAKNLLRDWFLEQEKHNDYCEVAQFNWRSNYGAYTELPFYKTSDPYYFECGLNEGKILFVPDITVFHKGVPIYLLEVVHKHPMPLWKVNQIKKFFNYNIELYEIEAEEILRHDKSIIPTYLECKRLT